MPRQKLLAATEDRLVLHRALPGSTETGVTAMGRERGVDGCDRPHESGGRCRQHAARIRNASPLLDEVPIGRRHEWMDKIECDCTEPEPDGIGECQRCKRLVVTDEVRMRARRTSNGW